MPSITKTEYHRRLNEVVNLLKGRQAKHTIVRYMQNRFGCAKRTTERHIRAARRILIEDSGQTREEHIVDAYSFYSSIVANQQEKTVTRMAAQAAIVHLLGLNTPIRVAQTDTVGNDVVSPEQVVSELLAIIAEIDGLTSEQLESTVPSFAQNCEIAVSAS